MIQRRIAVRGIILKDGKLLCAKLKKYAGKATDDDSEYWSTPGGGVDAGEPLIPALEREMVEELGVRPVIGNLLYVQQFVHKELEHLEFFFHITNADDYLAIDLSKTTHGAIEIEEVGFVDAAANTVLPAFLTQRDLTADVTAGQTQVFNNIAA
jgi:ADP-ribose pyrophosphatase YjhB (NUDIX family)